jgi:SAM-dependent methyltransferase
LKDSEDAYGHLVWDHFKGLPCMETVERDDGYLDPSEEAPANYFAPFRDWHPIEKRAVRYAKGRVLDVGVGAGRVSIHLQNKKKLDVLAIDTSPLAIRVSKARGLKKARLVSFEDFRAEPGSIDTVVMFGNNFGLFGSRRRAKRLLKRLYSLTSPDAVLLGESINPYETDSPYHRSYQEMNRRKGRMPGQVRIRVRYRTYVGRWFDYLLVSPEEMKELAGGTGWKVQRIIKEKGSPLYVGVLKKAPLLQH